MLAEFFFYAVPQWFGFAESLYIVSGKDSDDG